MSIAARRDLVDRLLRLRGQIQCLDGEVDRNMNAADGVGTTSFMVTTTGLSPAPSAAEARMVAVADLRVTRERLAGEERGVLKAIARLEAGTYGRCAECDGAIPAPRLRIFPEAERCVPCEARWERRRQVDTAYARPINPPGEKESYGGSLSELEFRISGLCQACQDEGLFAEPEHGPDDEVCPHCGSTVCYVAKIPGQLRCGNTGKLVEP